MKTIFSLCITLLLMIQPYIGAESKPVFISLGPTCEVALALRHFNIREAAYPFDWMLVYDLEGVTQALNDNFAYFLNPIFLQYEQTRIHNTYYRMSFVHDFPTIYQPHVSPDGENAGQIVHHFLDYLPAIQQKYNHRILRLKNLLESDSQVIFIRPHTSPLSAFYFTQALKNHYPKLNFLFVSVHNQEELNFDWNLERIANVFIAGRDENAPQAWWPLEIWAYILIQIDTLRQIRLGTP